MLLHLFKQIHLQYHIVFINIWRFWTKSLLSHFGRICVMVHFLLSSLSWCFLMGSDKFCSSIIAQKLWAIEPKRFPFSIWIIVNEPIQCSPSNVHGPRPCYSLIWAKLLSSVKRTRKYGWPFCNLMLAYFYRLFFFRTILFPNPKNKTVIVQKFYTLCFCLIKLP